MQTSYSGTLEEEAFKVLSEHDKIEAGLEQSFYAVCRYLKNNPDRLSWRSKEKPDLNTKNGLIAVGKKYFSSYNSSDFPATPNTVPDYMVSILMEEAFGYTTGECEKIKKTHQESMCSENAVGALLERYIDSVIRPHGWHWCCGGIAKAIDFIKENTPGRWYELQVKNRNNSENSSSSAIRNNTNIGKWFRTFSKTGATNWNNLPQMLKGYGLSESGFKIFVTSYLKERKPIK